jgi:hypothetical protein
MSELRELTAAEEDARFENEMAQIWSPHVKTDAERYRWLRTNMGFAVVGRLSYEGESVADLSPERVDFLVDRELKAAPTSDAEVKPTPNSGGVEHG